jgi:hypothetical protein
MMGRKMANRIDILFVGICLGCGLISPLVAVSGEWGVGWTVAIISWGLFFLRFWIYSRISCARRQEAAQA